MNAKQDNLNEKPAETYRVVGVRFDGSRHVTDTGQTKGAAEYKRTMLIFNKSYPEAFIELENPRRH